MDATAQGLIARLQRNPDDAEAFAALRAHYVRIGDYPALANLLEGWAGRAREPAACAHALYEAAELVLGALSDRERAIHLYERALTTHPLHADAFLRLRSLLDPATQARRLVELLGRRASALEGAGADARELALLHHELGELWEHRLGRADKAIHAYRRAFELDPKLVPAIYAAREIYRRSGNTKVAATLLEKEAKVEPDPTRRVALFRELAGMRLRELSDFEGAVLALKRALADAPGHLEVMNELARVYLARAQHVHDEHVATSDRHRASDLLHRIARQLPADLAIAYLEAALDARPDHEGALSLYERLCEERGQLERLPRRWVAYLTHVPDGPRAAATRWKLAEAYLAAGQIEYAITCLEGLLEARDARAAQRLAELYRAQGRDDDALRALSIAALGLGVAERTSLLREWLETSSSHERVEALRLLARMTEEHAAGDDRAFEAWARVLDERPSDLEAIARLEAIDEAKGRWERLLSTLEYRLEVIAPDARPAVLARMGRIAETSLGDLDRAAEFYRRALELAPGDSTMLDALASVYERAQRHRDLVMPQRGSASAEPDEARRAELHGRIARTLTDRFGNHDAAAEAWRELLAAGGEGDEARSVHCEMRQHADADEDLHKLARTVGSSEAPRPDAETHEPGAGAPTGSGTASFSDATNPSPPPLSLDSSVTVLDSALYTELRAAEVERAKSESLPRRSDDRDAPPAPLREVPTRKIGPPGGPREPAPLIPPARPDDFDDDYTAVVEGEDIFREIREPAGDAAAEVEAVEELGTGDIELLDELSGEVLADSDLVPLDEHLELAADSDGVQALDDVEASAPRLGSVPPPPGSPSPPR